MLQDCSCPADVDVGGDMPVMSMVDKTYMYIRSLKRETQHVINTHITDNNAAHECPRYSEDGTKDVGQIQGRLNNILGPGKSSALGPLPTQPQE